MTWNDRDDRMLAAVLRTVGTVESRMPRQVKAFPINAYLLDLRLRHRLGLSLV